MMSQSNLYTLFITITLKVTFSYAAVAHFPRIDSPKSLAHQPGCYSDLTNNILPYDIEVTPAAACVKLICLPSNFTEITTCDIPLVGNGCHIQKNKGRFPACCDTVVCNQTGTKRTPRLHYYIYDGNGYDYDDENTNLEPYFQDNENSNCDIDLDNDEQTITHKIEYNDVDDSDGDTENNDSDKYYSQKCNENEDETDIDSNRDADDCDTVYDDQFHTNTEYPNRYSDYYDYTVYDGVGYEEYALHKRGHNGYYDYNQANIQNRYTYTYDPPLYNNDQYEIYFYPYGYGDYNDYSIYRRKSSYQNN